MMSGPSSGRRRFGRAVLATVLLTAGLNGCVLSPEGQGREEAELGAAAPPFVLPLENRDVPPLPVEPEWRDVLSRAFLVNGELEAGYFEWKAAVARIDQAATWPNSKLAVSYSYMFSPGNIKTWNRSTIGVGFDPAMNLSLPVKVEAGARVALDSARATGERFRAAKFDLQRRVLDAYFGLALVEEKIRIQQENLRLLNLVKESAVNRAQAGGPLQDLEKAMIEAQVAEAELATMRAEAASMRGRLNGMLARDPATPLALGPALPAPRAVLADDARLIAVAVDQNPELASLAHEVVGRKDAIEVARLAYLPDFTPSFSITGSISQVVGAMVLLPTTLPAIRAAVRDAEAMARAAEATSRQTRQDRAASFVANLYIMRNLERQIVVYRERVMPAAEQLLGSSRQAYAAGTVGFADLIDSERMRITVQLMLAQLQVDREKRLAELEALAGVDIETLGQASTVSQR